MDLFFFFNVIKNIISSFFQNGIWVVGFFYLLNKTFASKQLLQLSKVVTIVALAFLFLHAVFVSI
ncbi:hypothetical protein HNQ85_002211 [Anoxybacillus calidus]|uniref:Uncharacterized protein n=1 Tax=[Anoxybacillus] calidus TaxID=575178 RepID=A0A7V9Z0P4_9BACL|nr:hypothetical protein [Anoxybacillus calidus]MBA2871921.1 hypothetical protein [Anoxybacillus calidus]